MKTNYYGEKNDRKWVQKSLFQVLFMYYIYSKLLALRFNTSMDRRLWELHEVVQNTS